MYQYIEIKLQTAYINYLNIIRLYTWRFPRLMTIPDALVFLEQWIHLCNNQAENMKLMVLQYIAKNLTFLFQLAKFFKCTQICFFLIFNKIKISKNLTKILKTY